MLNKAKVRPWLIFSSFSGLARMKSASRIKKRFLEPAVNLSHYGLEKIQTEKKKIFIRLFFATLFWARVNMTTGC